MTDAAIQQFLSDAAQKTLETMFFATPEAVSMDPQRPAGELAVASLVFQGNPPGRFGLVISDTLARMLASDFLGSDAPELLPADRVAGVVGELANMLCGAVLSEMESRVNFDLGAPEPAMVGADEPDPDFGLSSPSVCRLEFPEGALVAFLEFKEPA